MIFTIPDGWAVLVLEDTETRIGWFRERLPNATYCTTSAQAIQAIQQKPFRVVFLDHDLGFLDAADPYRLHRNGKEVARYLARTNFPGTIVIHSLNPIGSKLMSEILPQAHVAPFGTFKITVSRSAR